MSSFTRRIERQVVESRPHVEGERENVINPPKVRSYIGRGSKLGVKNPSDKALIARLKREQSRRDRASA